MQDTQGAGYGSPPAGPADGGAREVKAKVGSAVSEAREGAGRLVDDARSKAVEAVDHRKDSTAGRLEAVAGALREAAHKLEQDDAAALGGYAKSAANEAEKVARYLREKDVQSLTRDAETFARRHPEVFLGGAFVAGVLAARFLRSSTHRGGDGQESPREAAPGYQAGFEPFNPPHFEPTGGQ